MRGRAPFKLRGICVARPRARFDLNDFDESAPGPFEWDVKRLATSFEIAGATAASATRSAEPQSLAVARAYRDAMREFAEMDNLDVWYSRLDVER